MTRRLLSVLGGGAVALAQNQCIGCSSVAPLPRIDYPERREDPKLPNGRSQREAILKADYEKSLEDANNLIRLAGDLKIGLDKSDRHVLSVSTMKTLDDIEKVAKRIRRRMKRL